MDAYLNFKARSDEEQAGYKGGEEQCTVEVVDFFGTYFALTRALPR